MDNCSDERSKKKAKQQAEAADPQPHHHHHDYGGFASLPTDVLISIFCRSPASDHRSLSDTCKAFRATIDSEAYKGERASSGWAEVSTHLLSGEELYDELYPNGPEHVSLSDGELGEDATEEQRDIALLFKKAEKKYDEMRDFGYYSELGQLDQDNYGYCDITVNVQVDGKCCGSISLVLLPRGTDHDYPFHDATDAHSGEMQSVGWTLCDSVGHLKVRSIKNAELISGEAGKGGFLFIEAVRISEAYHPMDCTNIVTEAVRLALSDPKLEGKWTLVTAISDYQVYMTKEDQKILHGDESNAMEKERLDRRFWECALLDTKTLLRVGFRQIPETVSEKQSPYWLFALPSFLKDPIKSLEEVNQAPLIEPPDLPPEPIGVDGEILEVVKQKCNTMRRILDGVHSEKRELDIIIEHTCSEEFAELEQQITEARTFIDVGKPSHLSDETWRDMVAGVERSEEMLRTDRAMLEEAMQCQRDKTSTIDVKIPDLVNEFKAQVTALVRKGGSIRKSHAIHCCSRLRITQFIDFLIDMVPPEERAQALCSLDACGITPLHYVVLGTPEVSDTDEYIDFVKRLLDMGADTNVKSATRGVTPIGQYRLTMSHKFDFCNVFGMRSGDEPESWRPFHRKMEGLLRPSQGETDADVEAKCAVLDDDVDPDESSDNDEDDEEEEDDWMDEDEDDENENDDMMEVDEENDDSNDRDDED